MSSTTISAGHIDAARARAPARMQGPIRRIAVSDRKSESRASGTARTRRKTGREVRLGALDGHLGYYIRRLQVWVFQDFIRSLAPLDIRPAQYSVLTVIGANPGLSQSDIAEMLAIERARLVHVLDRLEKRGLTERQASPHDRRSHALHLTAEGQKVLKQARTLAQRHEANLVKMLGEENYGSMLGIIRRFGNKP
jgi:DNA-binding MarR family transcriptional regulator